MTITENLPDYFAFNTLLENNHFPLSAAECHGLATGVLCVTDDANSAVTALLDLLPNEEISLTAYEAIQTTMTTLCMSTAAQLADTDFGFRLLLPDDDSPLAQRSTAISQWCQSFISGLGEGGVKFESDYAKELQEIITDLVAISQVDTKTITESEEEEIAFTELAEYVRVAAITIYTDLLLENKNIITTENSQHLH